MVLLRVKSKELGRNNKYYGVFIMTGNKNTGELDEALLDIKTHYSTWRSALIIARDNAEVRLPDIDDKSFWDRELVALDRVYGQVIASCDVGYSTFFCKFDLKAVIKEPNTHFPFLMKCDRSKDSHQALRNFLSRAGLSDEKMTITEITVAEFNTMSRFIDVIDI